MNMSQFYLEIMEGANELHYVFERVDGEIKLIQKQACSCHTNHTKSCKDFFERYLEIFKGYHKHQKLSMDMVNEWSNKLKLTPAELENTVKYFLETTKNENPERLI